MNEDTRILQAYLDGELSDEQAAAVEERLAGDPVWRRELSTLQRLWAVVDEVPAPTAESDLWAGVAAGLAARRSRQQPWTLVQRGLAVAALVAGLMVGFGVGSLPAESAAVATSDSVDFLQDGLLTLDTMWLELGATDEDNGS